ncbi:MAG: hypothetical protein II471_05265, partial [Bacteroidales bacterium]|nr:hypothetical protein [Bacteroidales bacterium]
VEEWLDCGNKNITVATHQRVLARDKKSELLAKSAEVENSTIIPPCHIEDDVKIKNSVVGPYVSVGKGTSICGSVICNSVIQEATTIENMNIHDSMIGSHTKLSGKQYDLSIGDYNTLELK